MTCPNFLTLPTPLLVLTGAWEFRKLSCKLSFLNSLVLYSYDLVFGMFYWLLLFWKCRCSPCHPVTHALDISVTSCKRHICFERNTQDYLHTTYLAFWECNTGCMAGSGP
jgi:hypothetical protein